VSGCGSGQGGHDARFTLRRFSWGFALSETDALMLINEWNRVCVPPWSDSELLHK